MATVKVLESVGRVKSVSIPAWIWRLHGIVKGDSLEVVRTEEGILYKFPLSQGPTEKKLFGSEEDE